MMIKECALSKDINSCVFMIKTGWNVTMIKYPF